MWTKVVSNWTQSALPLFYLNFPQVVRMIGRERPVIDNTHNICSSCDQENQEKCTAPCYRAQWCSDYPDISAPTHEEHSHSITTNLLQNIKEQSTIKLKHNVCVETSRRRKNFLYERDSFKINSPTLDIFREAPRMPANGVSEPRLVAILNPEYHPKSAQLHIPRT